MSTYIGIGFSKDLDTLKAAKEAAAQAKANLNQEKIDLAIVLNTVHYNPNEFLPHVFDNLLKTKVIGSSTAAIILNDRIEKRGIAVLAVYSEEIRFETGCTDHMHLQDLKNAGQELAQKCFSEYGKEQRKLFLFFADGLLQDLSQFLAGLKENLGNNIAMIGAGSSDDFHFRKTYQYYEDVVLNSGACGVLLGGRVHMGASCRHGWRPLGKPRRVDKIEGNVIRFIDDKPAAHIYDEYFPSEAETIKASSMAHLNTRYPLGVPTARGQEYLLRNVLKTLEDDSLVLQDSVTEGQSIHLMIGNKDSCLRAAEAAATEAISQMKGRTPKIALVFESMARYRILGRGAEQEIKRVREIIGPNVPVLGMYSFGEIFTYTANDHSQTLVQNESFTILTIA